MGARFRSTSVSRPGPLGCACRRDKAVSTTAHTHGFRQAMRRIGRVHIISHTFITTTSIL